MFLMFVLALADGLCCTWFVYPISCWCRCLEVGTIATNSIDSAQLSRFHLKTETESSLRNVVFYIKTGWWIMSRNIIFSLIYHCHKI
jgi:hypothetical protein